MIMRLRRLEGAIISLVAAGCVATLAQAQCRCGLYLVTSQSWRPDHLAFSTGKTYDVDCSEPLQASDDCRRHCEAEVLALNEVFARQPEILHEYNPHQDLPCEALPAHTSSFYAVCEGQEWHAASTQLSSSVCCSPTTFTPVWCESVEEVEEEGRAAGQTVMQRKIDTETDQNAIENNEIQGSTKPAVDEEEGSWLTTFLRFFGYKSIGEMIQSVDIFSIPGKIQSLVRTYNDEISMGQCYMEFTTYSLFKQDGAFSSFLRNRRELPLDEAWAEAWEGMEEAILVEEGRAGSSHGQGSFAIENLVHGLVNMLEGSPTTRQYADIIKQLMPVVMQVYNSEDPSSAITTFISHTLGPYLSQIQSAPSKSPNAIDSNGSKPAHWPNLNPKPTPAPKTTPRPPSSPVGGSGGASSPITTMVLEFLKYYMGNYLSSLPGNSATKPPPPPTRAPAARPPASSSPLASSPGLGNILNLLFASPRPQKVPQPKPPVTKRPQKPQVLEKHDTKTFVDMVLEFIRPVFISIIGKAPGESGVASIREVTRLSSLGRVDDTLVEEVLSPYFCIKNYVVNKAWTLTERGVRSVANRFNPEEQERMMRMLQDD